MTWALKTHGLQHSHGDLSLFCVSPLVLLLVLSAKGRRKQAEWEDQGPQIENL